MIVDELRSKYKLTSILRVIGMSKSTYFYYKESKHINAENKRNNIDAEILKIAKPIYDKNKKRYGYRRIILAIDTYTLTTLNVGRDRIRKVLKANGLLGVQGRNRKFRTYKGDNGVHKENLLLNKEITDGKENLVRNFKTTKTNEKWTTDVSEFKIPSGKLYLSPVLDMFDASIISYDISIKANLDQIKRMLKEAFTKYKNLDGLIFHSDQGWQYQHKYYMNELSSRNIKQSFSRKGNCLDNSPMENFFGIMKNEMFYGHENEFETLDDLKEAMEKYILYYNTERINVKRKGLTPLEYRQKFLAS